MATFTLQTLYAGQYGVVQYDDGSFGVCHVDHYNTPTQEGALPSWEQKSNNMLGKTYDTLAEAQSVLADTLGGLSDLGLDVDNPANNPFRDQFVASDFPDGMTDYNAWPY